MATAKKRTAAGPADKGLRITTKRDGFRRAGRAWTGTSVVSLAELSADEVEAIRAEPMLLVDDVDMPAAA